MVKIFTRWISGVVFILLGLFIAIGPQTLFKPCQGSLQVVPAGTTSVMPASANARQVPMKCHWSARGEIAAGGTIALLGFLLLLFSKELVRFGLCLSLAITGFSAVLLPTKLIGVCGAKTMECNLLMLPMLLVLGGLVIALALINIILLFRNAGLAPCRKKR